MSIRIDYESELITEGFAACSSRYGPSGRAALGQPEVDYIEDDIEDNADSSPATGFEASGSQQALAASVWTDRDRALGFEQR